MAAPFQFPVQFVQYHVGEHRRERTALRNAHRRRFGVISHLDPGFEKAIDQAQQRRIRHVLLEPDHQPVMIDSIEKRFQVEIDHPAVAIADIRL